MIVSRFAIVTENFVICCYHITKFFSSRYGFAIASSAWCPCNFGLLTDLAISVFKETSINIVLTWILTSLENGLWGHFMRRIGVKTSCNGISSSHKNFPEFLHPFQDLRIQRAAKFYRGFLLMCFLNFTGLGCIRLPWSIIDRSWLTLALEKCHC